MPSIKNLFGSLTQPTQEAQWEDAQVDDYFNYSIKNTQTKWQEDSNNYYYKVALPGLTDKEIDVKVDDSHGDPSNPVVVIRAGTNVNDDGNMQYRPSTMPFLATFPVPTSRVKIDEIQASVDNGVLTMKFPKQSASQVQGGRAIPLNKSRL